MLAIVCLKIQTFHINFDGVIEFVYEKKKKEREKSVMFNVSSGGLTFVQFVCQQLLIFYFLWSFFFWLFDLLG